ncbi:MAG: methionine synthase [Pseudonocardia sp.]
MTSDDPVAREPDDPIARALAESGLAPPATEPDDPLARALARAGIALPDTAAAPEAVPPEPTPVTGPRTVTTRAAAPEDGEPAPLPRWPDGAATGVGSMPGTDPREAAATVVGELPLVPHLPELPARGVGADMIGRTAGLLVDLAVDVRPTGYRVVQRPGNEHRRAVDLLRFDVDALDEACAVTRPSWVKVQAAGPWTLAAAVELRSGHRVLTDPGAVRDFTESLVEGLRRHVTEVAARTGAQVLVQLDEPGLPAVLAGSLPTPSKLGAVAAVPEAEAQSLLRDVVTSLADGLRVPVVVHCCAARPPVRLIARSGVAGVGIDATAMSGKVDVELLDALGETWDGGTPLLLGLVPTLPPPGRVTARDLARPAFDLADRLGFERVRLAALALPTPACGLAGASREWARRALRLARELGEMFADPPDEG